jgi:vancomycin permeability regulator SanA
VIIRETGAVTVSTEAVTVATPRRRTVLRRAVTVLLVALVAAVVVVPVLATGFVVVTARTEHRDPTDVVVVLGAAQFDGRPSPVLEARLAHAQTLYSDGVAPQVVTVGGNQPGDRTTEAAVGQDWLVARGVPAQDVTSVPVGHDTLSSLTAVAHVMARRGWTSATIVTDPAHEARSIAMARALGIEAHGSPTRSGSGSSLTFEYVVRETGGLLYFWLVERRGIEQVVGT